MSDVGQDRGVGDVAAVLEQRGRGTAARLTRFTELWPPCRYAAAASANAGIEVDGNAAWSKPAKRSGATCVRISSTSSAM